MGLDYSFEMWVPREQLFEALTVIAKHSVHDEFVPMIWLDGRRLPFENTSDGSRDLVPVDGSLREDFCLSFAIGADEVLRRYKEESSEFARRNGQKVGDMRLSDGKISVGCIWTSFGLKANQLDWLHEEPLLTQISFTAATTNMSLLFTDSLSVKSFFVALAREMGAISCGLDKEGSGCEWLYLDGEEVQISADFLSHPRWARHLVRGEKSNNERRLRACIAWSFGELSAHQKMELALLTRDENSGLRAHALSIFSHTDLSLATPLIEIATRDFDWRARARAAYLIGKYEIETSVSQLEAMLEDLHPEVRIAAVKALGNFDSTFEILREVLLKTPIEIRNLGVIKAAIDGIAKTTFQPYVVPTLQAASARPNFPFPREVQERIRRFQS